MERVYASTRIQAGLYLQPSNDLGAVYVIASYEDGRDYGLMDGPDRVTLWSWGPITIDEITQIQEMDDMDEAVFALRDKATGHNTGYKTKREAIETALASTHGAHATAGSET